MGQQPEEIEVPVWWAPGNGMMYRRDCLEPEHPESTYNWIKRELGVDPEDYGVKKPITLNTKVCPICNKPF